jgi:uncharacterized protein YbjT (DUF2867 family)
MYVITGATGNTGSIITEILLEAGKQVRVVGRSNEGLQFLVDMGAEACAGSLEDEDFLTGAFEGAAAVYAMIPPNLQVGNLRAYQNQVGVVIANAIKRAGVKYVVHLSSQGAELHDGTGPIAGLHDQEQRLNRIDGVNILHLRPTFFMENFFMYIPLIKEQGINGSPLQGDLPIPVISTSDIAVEAARYLLELDFTGMSVKDLLGQRDMTMIEMTQIIGKAIGKADLQYIQFPYEDAEKAMVESGLSQDAARSFIELQRGINGGIVIAGAQRTAENTTETTFEEFAGIFAAVYSAV